MHNDIWNGRYHNRYRKQTDISFNYKLQLLIAIKRSKLLLYILFKFQMKFAKLY